MHWSVVGHQQQRKSVEQLLSRGALPRALLLSGPEGVGKYLFAMDVATGLLGGLSMAHNPDIIILKPGVSKETGKPTDISVKDVQDMKVWAYQRPLYGAAKVVLIDDADRLGHEAANALLKVLEEPPAYLYLFLITTLPGSLMQTIASRCQEMHFSPISDEEMSETLADLHMPVDDKQLLHIIARGRPGLARAYVQDKRLPEISQAIVQFQKLLASGVAERLSASKTLADNESLREVVAWWLSWAHSKLDARSDYAPIVRGLLELAEVLRESKYNQRLALDRFLLEVPALS